jgi:hypothetical protein
MWIEIWLAIPTTLNSDVESGLDLLTEFEITYVVTHITAGLRRVNKLKKPNKLNSTKRPSLPLARGSRETNSQVKKRDTNVTFLMSVMEE